nr:peroxidase 20 [Tanacetum cinerariifolium]
MAVRRMPYEQFVDFLEEKHGNYFQGLYCQAPNHDLERGLVRVSDDRSLSYMFDVEETFGKLNLYLDHLDMDLSKYLSQASTNVMDACVFKKIGHPKKRYCNDFSMDEMVDWAEMEVEQQGVESRTSTTNKSKEKVSQDATEVVKAKISTVKSDSESEYDSDDDSDYQSDKSVDYFSPGEEELIELKSRMKANREAKAKVKDNPISEMNKPNDENNMHADNIRVSVAQFKECLTYYALETGFSLWYERSCEARVVAKCGQRPPRLPDPEKGKQRKQTRFYVCFAGQIDGWKARDWNNHIYSVAWAVVNVKNKDNWTWFLELLEQDLCCSRGNGLTLMSDQHKGLMEAVKDVMPNTEHKQCVMTSNNVTFISSFIRCK